MKPRASGWMFAAPYLTLFTAFVIGPLLFGFALSLFRWELLSNVKPTFVGFEINAEYIELCKERCNAIGNECS